MVPLNGDLYSTVDALKVADTALFLVSACQQNGIDAVGENVLTSSLAQGLPSTIVAVMDLDSLPPKVTIVKTNWLITVNKSLLRKGRQDILQLICKNYCHTVVTISAVGILYWIL